MHTKSVARNSCRPQKKRALRYGSIEVASREISPRLRSILWLNSYTYSGLDGESSKPASQASIGQDSAGSTRIFSCQYFFSSECHSKRERHRAVRLVSLLMKSFPTSALCTRTNGTKNRSALKAFAFAWQIVLLLEESEFVVNRLQTLQARRMILFILAPHQRGKISQYVRCLRSFVQHVTCMYTHQLH